MGSAFTRWNSAAAAGRVHSSLRLYYKSDDHFWGGATPSDVNDVWTLSLGANPAWTELSPGGTPPAPRQGIRAGYDGTNSRMIIFGGGEGSSSPCTNDVWVLANANGVSGVPTWLQLNPSGSPPVRFRYSSVYDPVTNTLIVFGGNDCFNVFYNDVWLLSNANGLGGTPTWTQLSFSGTTPPPTGGHFAIYDPVSNRMIVLLAAASDPNRTDQLWVLSNANGTGGTPSWSQIDPGVPNINGFAQVGVYDAESNRMITFGGGLGNDDINDTWLLSNANDLGGTPGWTQLSPAGTLPAAREEFPAIFVPARDQMVIFGGYSNGTLLNDVWVLNLATVDVTVGTSPAGESFSVDGASYTATQSFTWTVGDSHTIATTSPQGTGTQYTFTGWSDDGAISHSVTASANTTSYTASFDTSYLLTTAVSPAGAGTVSAGGYYAPNSVVAITAVANSGYTFQSWTGAVANPGSPMTTIKMTGPENVTANFVPVVAGLGLSTNGLNFGEVDLGDKKDLNLTVKNTGAIAVKITKISFNYGPGTGKDFGYFTQCGGTLKPGASCKITVELHAQDLGNGAAVLNIFSTASGSPAQVSLTGTVINPKAKLSKNNLNFGSVKVGHSSVETVVVTSTGDTPLTIDHMTVTGSSDFTVAGCTGPLSPGSTCVISVTFTPSAKKPRSATLKVIDNALSSPQVVSLSGKGD